MATLDQWKTNVGQLIMLRLPNHDLDSARALALSWLNANGGWIPDNVGDPTGEGHASSSNTSVADAVKSLELAKVKTITVDFPVVLRASITGSFGSGSTAGDILALFQANLESRVSEILGTTNKNALKPISFTWGSATTTLRTTGDFDVTKRASVATEITSNTNHNLIDVAAIATNHARSFLGLDATWVSSFVYSKDNNAETPVSVEIKKYTDTSYSVLDTNATSYYVVTLDRDSGRPQTITRRST